MIRIFFVSISVLLVVNANTQQNADITTYINNAANKIEQKCINWRRDIHQHPELGNREFRTANLIADHLRSLGLEVKEKVAHTGVVGILKGGKPGPVIALRADMDALPVAERNNLPFKSNVKATYNGQEVSVMHACGHDTHVAMLMSVAEILAGMKNNLSGTVKFIFQPAEEGAPKGEEGGAELMVKEGVLENPKVDVIFGLHISAQTEVGKITYRPGGFYASVNDMKITVKGRQAHGAAPWSSIDPVIVSAQIINNLQTVVSRNLDVTENAGVITIGAIHGGVRSNIIPEQVEMLGTIRALTLEDEKMMITRIKQIVSKTAEALGAVAEAEIPYSSHYPITFNHIVLTNKMLPSLQRAAGTDKVELIAAKTGAEDFSFFQQKVPGLFFNVGGMPKGKDPKKTPSHHTPDFYIDEEGMKTGIKAFLYLVTDYMKSPGVANNTEQKRTKKSF
ncbi:MAG: amidohydrolase [Chitinophagaceae bacterium]